MFVLRDACLEDEEAIRALALHLNTLNLPAEHHALRELLENSQASFAGVVDPTKPSFVADRRFLLVLENEAGAIVGTSMIHAQHGTPGQPHAFFDVVEQECYAEIELPEESRQVHMHHQMLYLGRTYAGPTEIGALVLDPQFRGHPEKLGRLLSLGRFAYIAAFRESFCGRVLAELLPDLHKDGRGETCSLLWDALGSRFTGLSYAVADRLSREDKEFIWRLFPSMPVHVSMLPKEVQERIGKVGDGSKGAARLLESIGFQMSGRIDPFDGGPHYEADCEQISVIKAAQWSELAAEDLEEQGEQSYPEALLAISVRQAPFFKVVWAPYAWQDSAQPRDSGLRGIRVSAAVRARLGLEDGQRILVAPRHL